MHRLPLQHEAAEVLAEGAAHLVDALVAQLGPSGRVGMQRRCDVVAVIVEGRQIPATDQMRYARTPVAVVEVVARPVLRHHGVGRHPRICIEVATGLADAVEAGLRHPQQLEVGVGAEVFRSHRPLPDAHALELGLQEIAHVARGDHVGEEEAHHLAPHHVLAAEAELPVAMTDVHIGLSQHEITALVAANRSRIVFVLEVEGAIELGTRIQLPAHPRRELPAAGQLPAGAQVRPALGIAVGVCHAQLGVAAPLDARRRLGARSRRADVEQGVQIGVRRRVELGVRCGGVLGQVGSHCFVRERSLRHIQRRVRGQRLGACSRCGEAGERKRDQGQAVDSVQAEHVRSS